MKRQCCSIASSRIHPIGPVLAGLLLAAAALNASAAVTLDEARWDAGRQVLVMKGTGVRYETVTAVNANDPAQILGNRQIRRSKWGINSRHPDPVPCAVSVRQSNGDTAGPMDVANRLTAASSAWENWGAVSRPYLFRLLIPDWSSLM